VLGLLSRLSSADESDSVRALALAASCSGMNGFGSGVALTLAFSDR